MLITYLYQKENSKKTDKPAQNERKNSTLPVTECFLNSARLIYLLIL